MSRRHSNRPSMIPLLGVLVLVGFAAPSHSQAPAHLVRDIQTGVSAVDSFSSPILSTGAKGYLTAWDPEFGSEVWVTDGSASGTRRLRETYPGDHPLGRGAVGGTLALVPDSGLVFFLADDGSRGVEVWRTDGTDAGTFSPRDVRPGNGGRWTFLPDDTVPLGRFLYFFQDSDSTIGRELWRTDGTFAGTTLVAGLEPNFYGYAAAALGSSVYFLDLERLWKSNGTAAGTSVVKSVGSGYPYALTAAGSRLFFAKGHQLWVSDGTSGGTVALFAFSPGTSLSNLTASGDTLYFSADDGSNGRELWRSDGTTPGTGLVRDLRPTGGSNPEMLVSAAGLLYFSADDGTNGRELWVTDGTAAETRMVKNIHSSAGSQPENGTFVGGRLFFAATGDVGGRELWTSDGTGAGTTRVTNVNPFGDSNPGPVALVNGAFVFSADDGEVGQELWTTDGTEAGTTLLRNLAPDLASSAPRNLTDFGGTLVFDADDDSRTQALWRSDGTSGGTVNVTGSRIVNRMTPIDGHLVAGNFVYFQSHSDPEEIELWKTDGTPSGATLVADINPSGSSWCGAGLAVGSTVYFSADDGTHGFELWRSDGAAPGTALVSDIAPGPLGSRPFEGVALGSTLYFSADDGTTGRELWTSQGTPETTRLVSDIFEGASGFDPISLTPMGGTLYFGSSFARELWRTDGTEVGTVLVAFGPYLDFTPVGSRLFSLGEDWSVGTGLEVMASDGTWEGSGIPKDIFPGLGWSAREDAAFVGGAISNVAGIAFFAANDGVHGSELWRSDGTEAGTWMVRDLWPGPDGSSPEWITPALPSGRALFVAADPGGGRELWRTDGTSQGTYRLADIRPGAGHSNPAALTPSGAWVYFTADDGVAGRELWAVSLATPGAVPDGFSTPGKPLRMNKEPGGFLLAWNRSCASSDTDYAVYRGSLGDFDGHQALLCSTSGASEALLAPLPGNEYYLAVATDGTAEGSYGRRSDGSEIPPAAAACLPREISSCP